MEDVWENSGFPSLVKHGFYKVENGPNIYYELHGNGPEKLVFITGFITSILTWKFQLDFFSNALNGNFQILVLDNRGYGHSDKPFSLTGYTTDEMANDTHLLLKHLGWTKYHLLGHSMGGMISQKLAMLNLEALQSLTLYATFLGGLLNLLPLQGYIQTYKLLENGLSEISNSILGFQYQQSWLDEMNSNTSVTNRRAIIPIINKDFRWACHGGSFSHVGLIGQLFAVMKHSMSKKELKKLKETLQEKSIPLLVLVGSSDYLVDTKNSAFIQKYFNCQLSTIDGGHMIHIQKPDEFNKVLLDHFSNVIKSKL